jgi:ribose transport system substrate-binding protein
MKSTKTLSLAISALMLGPVLAGCSGDSTDKESPTKASSGSQSQGYKLGFSFGLDDTPIYSLVLGPAKKRADQLGVSLVEGSAKSKCETQVSDIENMISTGVKAVTFLGLCGEGAAYDKVVADGQAKGVTMVSYAFQHPMADGSISFDDAQAGQDIADAAAAWAEKKFEGDYAEFSWGLLSCSFAPPSIQERFLVPKAAIAEATGKDPVEADCANDPKSAQEVVDTWLAKDPGLDMVLAYVDSAGLGAYQAFKQAGAEPGSVFVGGIDGQREAVELIAQGGDGIYQYSGALQLTGPLMVDIPNNIITGDGPGTVTLNYTPLTSDDPQGAKDWITNEFEPWD